MREYYDHVQRTAQGLNKLPEELIDKFLRGLNNKQAYLNLIGSQDNFVDLRQAIECAERLEEAYNFTQTSKVCIKCGKAGHIACFCRSGKKTFNNNKNDKKGVKVQQVEEELLSGESQHSVDENSKAEVQYYSTDES